MKNATLTKVTTVYSRGREFYILRDSEAHMICGVNKKYWGVDKALFDENGKLTKQLNGCSGHLSATVAECVEAVLTTIEIEHIAKTTGCTMMEAIEAYYMSKINS